MKKLLTIFIVVGTLSGCMERPVNVEHNISLSTKVVTLAKTHLGKPYKYGATGPNSFDCSGFVFGVFKSVGVALPRTSRDQSKIGGSKLKRNQLKVGDLVFFDTSKKGSVNHSGIYLGNNEFIHASSGKAYSVTTSSMNGWYKDKFKWGKRITY